MCSLVTGSQMPSAKHLAFRDVFMEPEEVELVALSGRQFRALKRSLNANQNVAGSSRVLKRSRNANQISSGHPPEKCFYLPS